MTKKLLTLLIASTVILTGCGASNNKEAQDNQNNNKQEEAAANDEKDESAETAETAKEDEATEDDENKESETAEKDETAETTEVTETSGTVSTVEGLSDDLYSFQVYLEGNLYTLPCDIKQFLDNGWEIEDNDESFKLASNQYSIGTAIKKGDARVSVQFINFSDSEAPLDQCSIGKITADRYIADGKLDFMLPKGIKVGSSREELIAAYGEPTDTYASDSFDQLTYHSDQYVEVEFSIDNEENKISSIGVQKLVK